LANGCIPEFFTYTGNEQFKEITTNLSNLYGWWQSVATADVNKDGLPDLILGNIGSNFYLHPAQEKPVKNLDKRFLIKNGIKDKKSSLQRLMGKICLYI